MNKSYIKVLAILAGAAVASGCSTMAAESSQVDAGSSAITAAELQASQQRINELGEDVSKLSPFWYAGAYAIGAASGILGDKWSLGFIAETERQVCAHLDSHLESLPPEDAKSRAIVEQMRDEEEEHGENAKDAGAADLPAPVRRLMQITAKVMTKTAYWV